MDKKYFDTDSTGSNDYFKEKNAVDEEHVGKSDIKDFSIDEGKYKKSQVKMETVHYEIKD